MAKNVLLLFAILSIGMQTTALSQSFEGYIKYSFKADLGAENNAKMAQAQEKMNSPEMQAQMQAMKEKMNDPEFKKMMESNPQLKAQVEAMMAPSQNKTSTGGTNNFMPKDAIIYLKNGNSLYRSNGGASAMMGDILYLKDKDQSFHLYKDRKAYKAIPKTEQKKSTATVTKTTETQQVLGHTCTKYIVKDGEINMNIWATTELPNVYDQMKRISLGRERSMYMDQIAGIPLKIESQSRGMQFTMEVTELKEQPQNATDFIIPAGYKEEK